GGVAGLLDDAQLVLGCELATLGLGHDFGMGDGRGCQLDHLVCALSSVELSPSFEHRGTHLVRRVKPCQVLYQPGLKYRQQGNCFVWIEDYGQAQKLMNQQWEINWAELPNGFAGQLNPLHENIFEQYPASYYWTAYQSEWATAIVFREADFLKRLMPLPVLTTASTTVHQLNQLPKAA
ncbi:MAG: hypothetical protein AAB225_32000, partial [Acidobacteriota bacterium]